MQEGSQERGLLVKLFDRVESDYYAPLTLPPHLQTILPDVVAGDPTATRVFLAEALKSETGESPCLRPHPPWYGKSIIAI